MKKFLAGVPVWTRLLRAQAVFLLDKKFKRNPKIADRMRYFRDQYAGLQKMYETPEQRKKLTPELEQQVRLMGPWLRMMEQAIKKNPDITMNQLEEITKNPELQTPRVRTRPGPPMRGRRRF